MPRDDMKAEQEAEEKYRQLFRDLAQLSKTHHADLVEVAHSLVENLPARDIKTTYDEKKGGSPLHLAQTILARSAVKLLVEQGKITSTHTYLDESFLKATYKKLGVPPITAEGYANNDVALIREKAPIFLEKALNEGAKDRMKEGMQAWAEKFGTESYTPPKHPLLRGR